MPSKNLGLLLHRFHRSMVRAMGQFVRENAELVIIVNDEVEDLRRFHKRETQKTRAVAAREWDSTMRALGRHHGGDFSDLPNPFAKASE